MFDNQETTDDHGMEIVGVAKDQNGNRYYKVKNSWDTIQVVVLSPKPVVGNFYGESFIEGVMRERCERNVVVELYWQGHHIGKGPEQIRHMLVLRRHLVL